MFLLPVSNCDLNNFWCPTLGYRFRCATIISVRSPSRTSLIY
jgi:hypothetical protein